MSEQNVSAPLPRMYPVFLKMEGIPCLVIGGGPIAYQKASELWECGAVVRVISPDLDAQWTEAIATSCATHIARPYAPGDVGDARMVISATADPVVDAMVYEEARARGAWVNIVDVPDRCEFYAGSVVRRGPVVVSISTSGASPSLAIAIRRRVERALPAGVGDLAATLGKMRASILSRFPSYRPRADRMNHVVARIFEELSEELTCPTVPLERALRCPHETCNPAACCAFGSSTMEPSR